MRDALHKFLLEKDPLGTAETLTVTEAELEALLDEHTGDTGDFDSAVLREREDFKCDECADVRSAVEDAIYTLQQI